jgi:hypothetical protein
MGFRDVAGSVPSLGRAGEERLLAPIHDGEQGLTSMMKERIERSAHVRAAVVAAALAIVASTSVSTAALAQGPQGSAHWLPGHGVPGADQYVSAITSWDPDGDGPEGELLVIAGGFEVVGDQKIQGLAGWDGASWHAIDPNSGGDIYTIRALAAYHGELIAAGDFSTLSGVACNAIARYDGHVWHPLGVGADNGLVGNSGYAHANTLRVVGDRLIVGGLFDRAGGVDSVNIAAWDGTSDAWAPLGDGLSVGTFDEGVYSLAEHGGRLVAAGDFTRSGARSVAGIASFDGTQWTGYPALAAFQFFAVASFSGHVVAGGMYYDANNTDPDYIGDSLVVEWDDAAAQWNRMGSPLGSPGFLGVVVLKEFNGELYAAGDFFDGADDSHGMLLRRWNGVAWQALGQDFGGFNGVYQPSVAALAVHRGRLIVGGSFSHARGTGAFDLAAWSGSTWSAFETGTNGPVFQIVSLTDAAVVSGSFDSIEGAHVPQLASWNGVAWSPVADSELQGANPLGVFEAQLIVASSFVDGQVRHLEGGAWLPFGEGIPEGFVTCMTTYRSQLIVGGHFDFTGVYGDSIHNVARWDGDHWRSVGAGVDGASWNSPVNAMVVYAGTLVVAGGLDTAGGSPCNAIASWDGNTWSALSSGLTDPPGQVVVWALAVYRGELVATGQFQHAGGIAARNIARWDGAQWNALGAGGDSTLSSWGRALQVLDDNLYVGGSFAQAGGVEVHKIARWDGSSWFAMDGGVTSSSFTTVDALGELDGVLLVGGSFVQTGAGVSAFIARWSPR